MTLPLAVNEAVVPPPVTVVPVSIPLTNIFKPATVVAGIAVNDMPVAPLVVALAKEDTLAAVLTRRTDSLFRVTNVVPNVLGEEEVLGLYVYPALAESIVIDKVESVMRR